MKKMMMVAVLIALFSIVTKAQLESEKAKFLYSMIKYMDWPTEDVKTSFKIGVIGSFSLYKEISEVTMGRKMNDVNIEVINVNKADDLKLFNLQVLMVSNASCNKVMFEKLKPYTNKSSVLVITENNSISFSDAGLCFTVNNQKLGFTLNKEVIHSKGISTSNYLDVFANKE